MLSEIIENSRNTNRNVTRDNFYYFSNTATYCATHIATDFDTRLAIYNATYNVIDIFTINASVFTIGDALKDICYEK